jgi:hypothetical protein
MLECARCHHPVARQALTCPHCGNPLKAHGHPGIPLHQAPGNEPLCLTCIYHADDSCNYPKRPEAMDCTLYTNQVVPTTSPSYTSGFMLRGWLRRNMGLLTLVGLIGLSLAIALAR